MSVTLTDLCEVMNNWFDTKSDGTKDRHFGIFTIENNSIDLSGIGIKPGQYYRIVGSVFNDGVWQYPYPQVEEQPTTTESDNNQNQPDITDDTDTINDTNNTDDTVNPDVADNTDNADNTDETGDTQNTDTTTNEPSDDESDDEDKLVDEVFDGAIWLMYVPQRVLKLLDEINDWNDVYGPIVASPFNSESFGGYSYYKGYKNTTATVASSWASKFTEQINRWRKVRRFV